MNDNIELLLTDLLVKQDAILVFFQEDKVYKVDICDQNLHVLTQVDISSWIDLCSLEGVLLAFDLHYQIMVGCKVSKSGILFKSNLVKMHVEKDKYILENVCNEATRSNLRDSLRHNNDIILEHFKVKNNNLIR